MIKFIVIVLALLISVFACSSEVDKPIPEPVSVTATVKFTLVPDYTYFPKSSARLEVVGCATSLPEIFVIGYVDSKGKIYFNHAVMGHEIQHILRIYDDDIKNPDDK